SFKIKNMNAILDESEQYILSLPITDFDYRNKIENQKQYLGFVALVTGNEEDRPKLYVKSTFPIHRKKDGALCGYNIVAQSIGSGIETRYTVWNRIFNKIPITEGDIIRCTRMPQRDGQNFTLEAYELIY
ncbi:hypothetical protein, partial [Bacteroides sp.]|uniref:hypothetical protein n=1 Tax=Bacteroides sp. TaxID=29523 RepID=UPI00262A1E02